MAVASVGDQLLGELRHGRIQVVAYHVDDGSPVTGRSRDVVDGVSPLRIVNNNEIFSLKKNCLPL